MKDDKYLYGTPITPEEATKPVTKGDIAQAYKLLTRQHHHHENLILTATTAGLLGFGAGMITLYVALPFLERLF